MNEEHPAIPVYDFVSCLDTLVTFSKRPDDPEPRDSAIGLLTSFEIDFASNTLRFGVPMLDTPRQFGRIFFCDVYFRTKEHKILRHYQFKGVELTPTPVAIHQGPDNGANYNVVIEVYEAAFGSYSLMPVARKVTPDGPDVPGPLTPATNG